MRVAMVSAAARAGRVNEDFAGAVPMAAVVVDGAGIPGAGSVCRHGVAWYATRLGGSLLSLLALMPDNDLPALLAEAIVRVTDDHRDTCDVASRISPSATVAVLRVSAGRADHLVLGDSTVVLDRTAGAPLVVNDPREVVVSRSYLPALAAAGQGTAEYQRLLDELRGHRNEPGGFWVAKDDPRAAYEALTGSRPVTELDSAVLLSNGAGRIVDKFGPAGWPEVLATLAARGPAAVIDRVRAAEADRGVSPDDATIAHCTELSGPVRSPGPTR
ncbi:hypothetical protein AB0C12_16520 [Actinoplanes sp. NPDC048967]|uniref:hypothetical protein n=1 Tax=Actinoplanes sp. NPDC048967 TaxID=3155269 RepID=UPI00340D90C9